MQLASLLLTLILSLLATALALTLFVLLAPVGFHLRGVYTEEQVDARVSASLGLGLVSLQASPREGLVLRLLGWPARRLDPRRLSAPGKAQRKAKKAKKPRTRPRLGLRFMGRVLRRVWPTLKLRARVQGRIGAGDPADTARLYGWLTLGQRWLPGLDTSGLHLDWLEPRIDLAGEVHGRLWPLAIVWVTALEYTQTRWRRRAQQREAHEGHDPSV